MDDKHQRGMILDEIETERGWLRRQKISYGLQMTNVKTAGKIYKDFEAVT